MCDSALMSMTSASTIIALFVFIFCHNTNVTVYVAVDS